MRFFEYMLTRFFIWIAPIALLSCHGPKENISQQTPKSPPTTKILTSIKTDYPSASAGILCQNQWWILGDDATSLLQISLPFSDSLNTLYSHYIALPYVRETKGSDSLRVKKKVKLDFEAMAHYKSPQGHDFIWAFGSGSKQPERDSGLFMELLPNQNPLHPKPYKLNLGPLYQQLQRLAKISPETWNIEGACVQTTGNGNLYLLHRNPALLFQMPLKDWFRYVEIGSLPYMENIKITSYRLPEIDGHKAGFSGATYDAQRNSIWFCASVEITEDPKRDGEILGSFIGEISLSSGEILGTPVRLEDHQGKKLKLESISLLEPLSQNQKLFLGTVDNDDGSSLLLQIIHYLPPKKP